MTGPDCSQWDAIADAILKVWKGGGIQLGGMLLLGIFLYKAPWVNRKPKVEP